MKYYRVSALLLLISLWILSACGTTDTVLVVEQQPAIGAAEQGVEEPERQTRFVEISIGLIEPVTNLDPLFAGSLSAKRVVSLLYSGLVTLDREGEPVLDLASDIQISDDGRIYTITLNRENFYRSSSVFPTGMGRRIHAADVKYAFQRTAGSRVPPAAAGLLMGVNGFEDYFLEQRRVYDEERRVLSDVRGIQVADAETVLIELNDPDDEFIKKLASPYLVIYPREAVENNRSGFAKNPVGAGAYNLSQMEDSLFSLVRRDRGNGEPATELPPVNRINFKYFENEVVMMQSFTAGDIDWIPDAGPQIQNQMLNSEGNLMAHYAAEYGVSHHDASRLTYIYRNDETEANGDWLRSRLSMVTEEDFEVPGNIRLLQGNLAMNESAVPDSVYYITLTEDPFARTIFNQMNSVIFQPESSLVYYEMRIPTPLISLYSGGTDSLHRQWLTGEAEDQVFWMELESEIVSLYHSGMQNIEASAVPWLLHLHEITVQEPN